MKTTSSEATRAAIAALLLCATFGTAWAQELYEMPAEGVVVLVPSLQDEGAKEQAATRALVEHRQ